MTARRIFEQVVTGEKAGQGRKSIISHPSVGVPIHLDSRPDPATDQET
jgi:hypothetical protein